MAILMFLVIVGGVFAVVGIFTGMRKTFLFGLLLLGLAAIVHDLKPAMQRQGWIGADAPAAIEAAK